MENLLLWSRFVDVSKRYPDKTAISYESKKVTYHDLYLRACYLSSLISNKTENNEKPLRVAILIEDRIQAIVSIFAILKLGAAFIALDPEDPEGRLSLVLKDAEPSLLLTGDVEFDKAKSIFLQDHIVNVSLLKPDHSLSNESYQADVTPHALAYIIYTSGTTGNPKGVCQNQRNLMRHVDAYSEKLGIKDSDHVSLLYTLSFSAANMDIFGALFNGATLHAYNTRKFGVQKLASWIEKEGISILHAVPTVLKKSLSYINTKHSFKKIRCIDLGGESLSFSDVVFFRNFFDPSCKIINHLAATEISVIAQYEIPLSLKETGQLIPVGNSPRDVEIQLVDDEGIPVKQGAQGKIIISSPYLAIGYWNYSDLDKKYFKEDPSRKGWRIFYSDDFGFFDENQNLIFVGRKGSRIKIRGQSIDINEVEIALKKFDYIEDTAILPYHEEEDAAEPDSIIAHLVFKKNAQKDFVQIRKDLASILPQYMLPNLFMLHQSLPQTASGKLDRNLLASLRVENYRKAFEAPVGFLEANIAHIFQKINKLDKLPGRQDDFFLLGGDSMGVIELQLSLNQIINKEVPLKDIFFDSSVTGLAKLLEKVSKNNTSSLSSLLVQLSDKGHLSPLFIVHGRAGQAPVSPYFINLFGDMQPIYAFQAKGMNGLELPAKNIKEAALDYINEMKKIQPKGPYYLGAMCVGSYVVMLMAQLLIDQGEKIYPLLLIDPAAPPFTAPPEVLDSEDFMRKFSLSAKENVIRNAKEGKYRVDLTNDFRRNAAIYIAIHFVRILSRFKPMPYSGEVCMIVSDGRMDSRGWGDASKFNAVFSGKVKAYKIHGKHDEILDSKNHEFTNYLKEVLSYIRNYKF